MANCIVAQSGGPTPVINSSAMGVLCKNKELNHFDKVYAGINGIEGILNENIVDLSDLTDEQIDTLKYTPAAGLGSCRYKLQSYETSTEEYDKLFDIMEKHNISTLFYIGGNDSMDTVNKLGAYADIVGKPLKFIGIPKTIDNDLPIMDHTPGFGSAAKLIATSVLENYLDLSVYNTKSAFIVETMGRDTGWLAASGALATIDGNPIADFIYLPESIFDVDKFLADVKLKLETQNHIMIVVSEGIKNADGVFISELQSQSQKDVFGHTQLGGVGNYLKNLLISSGVIKKVRSYEISTSQRCGMHTASQVDIDEAFAIGGTALEYSIDGTNGMMVAIERVSNAPYKSQPFVVETSKIANQIKYFPTEWINEEGNHITAEALEYLRPLINGTPQVRLENGLPQYTMLKNIAKCS